MCHIDVYLLFHFILRKIVTKVLCHTHLHSQIILFYHELQKSSELNWYLSLNKFTSVCVSFIKAEWPLNSYTELIINRVYVCFTYFQDTHCNSLDSKYSKDLFGLLRISCLYFTSVNYSILNNIFKVKTKMCNYSEYINLFSLHLALFRMLIIIIIIAYLINKCNVFIFL